MYKLWFDTETGGLNPRLHSLLTAYFAICDEDLKVIDELYLQLKPSDLSQLNVTKDAMDVNNIDLKEHLNDPATITYEEGRRVLKEFLNKHKITGKKKSYTPCGHNIQFDKDMIWEQLMPREEWEEFVHYRTIDTTVLVGFLKEPEIGILPKDLGNLESLVEYLEVPKGEVHNARADVLMNIEVYRRLVSMFKERKVNMTGASGSSLLQIIEE